MSPSHPLIRHSWQQPAHEARRGVMFIEGGVPRLAMLEKPRDMIFSTRKEPLGRRIVPIFPERVDYRSLIIRITNYQRRYIVIIAQI